MSKAALNMLSKKLALEFESAGVAVLALHPGWVQTRMGGSGAALDVDTAADGMVRVIDAFSLARSGAYLTYDGSELPW
jgi:NAD(P)-dependent dehydrogenase (short-subunit alcohol dehydrogenase family)